MIISARYPHFTVAMYLIQVDCLPSIYFPKMPFDEEFSNYIIMGSFL